MTMVLAWPALGVLVVAALGQVDAAEDGDDDSNFCKQIALSSWGFKYASQTVDINVKVMEVLKKYSRSDCDFKVSFGFDNKKKIIWVDKGCRALFRVCDRNDDDSKFCERIALSSWGFKYASQAVERKVKVMEVLEKYSRSDCDSKVSFGFDNKNKIIWVDKGCRALFRVCDRRYIDCVGATDHDCEGRDDGNYQACGELCKEGYYVSCAYGIRHQVPCPTAWYENSDGPFLAKMVYNPRTDTCERSSPTCKRPLDEYEE